MSRAHENQRVPRDKSWCILFLAFVALAATAAAEFQFRLLTRATIEKRLRAFPEKDRERLALLRNWFAESGCAPENLSEQAVKFVDLPNLICVLPGETDLTIVVGAHYDHLGHGQGVVDNWSGAALLPSLLESVSLRPRRHTYAFVAFSAEEQGLLGSEYYVSQLTAEQRKKISAMVNLDSLGLGPTKVSITNSEAKLTNAMAFVGRAMQLPVGGITFDLIGDTDSSSFARRKIPVISLHSIAGENWRILHTPRDKLIAIRIDDYYDSYRLIAGYLAFLDGHLQPQGGVQSRPTNEK